MKIKEERDRLLKRFVEKLDGFMQKGKMDLFLILHININLKWGGEKKWCK